MIKLFTLFLEICAFKKGPQDVPAAKALLQLLIGLYMAISFLVLILNLDAVTAFMQAVVETMLVLGFPWLILNLAKKQARYLQTVTALLGCDIL